jgi:ADP-dependent NAD(P)H-hydrate dehydratase / NAD(P)H-hydrate epimerase
MHAMPVRITPDQSWPLHGVAATRAIEHSAAAALPPHTLMQRAGLAVARLACALAPHAQTIWVACGPGNNGGDGFEAAMHLQRWGHRPVVTLCGDEARLPPDAAASLARARAAGVTLASTPPAQCDLAIDALLGIGSGSSGASAGSDASGRSAQRALPATLASHLLHMHSTAHTILCVDLPSGLHADTGTYADPEFTTKLVASRATIHWPGRLFCLSLLTLKPGTFTAQGKDAAGQVWWDDLACLAVGDAAPDALLLGSDRAQRPARLYASHKGSYGDVAVIGGAPGMTGAALLAARAALHAGAGRVLVGLLDGGSMAVDTTQPELMFRPLEALNLRGSTVVCGCGGGDAVRSVLAQVLSQAPRLVLDADALNAIALDTALQTLLTARAARSRATVITPHPLEAARLLGSTTAQVQAHRLQAAQQLALRFACTVVLKGAGSVVAAPGQVPYINASGNARLASAGTGDVLAGMVGACITLGCTAFGAACAAVHAHGLRADLWPPSQSLTASTLATAYSPVGFAHPTHDH